MLKIGYGKPSHQAGGFYPPPRYRPKEWYTNDWFWVPLSTWMEIKDFQDYKPGSLSDEILKFFGHDRLQMMLTRSGGQQCWQLNVMSKDCMDYVRVCLVLGQQGYEPWTWADVHLRRPYHLVLATVKTFLWKLWNETLRGIDREKPCDGSPPTSISGTKT